MHMPWFKHGFDEHGLVSIEQVGPAKYWLQAQTNFLSTCEKEHKPFREQFPKQLFVSIFLENISSSWFIFKFETWNEAFESKKYFLFAL